MNADTKIGATVWSPTPDVSFIEPRGCEKGWDQIAEVFYVKTMGELFTKRTLKVVGDANIQVYGNAAVVEFNWDFVALLRSNGKRSTRPAAKPKSTPTYQARVGDSSTSITQRHRLARRAKDSKPGREPGRSPHAVLARAVLHLAAAVNQILSCDFNRVVSCKNSTPPANKRTHRKGIATQPAPFV